MTPDAPPEAPRHSDAAPLAATLVSLVAFVFCVFAKILFRWHPAITGPLLVASAVALVASVVWLNRWAGRGDDEDDEPEPRPDCSSDACHHTHPELPRHGEGEQS